MTSLLRVVGGVQGIAEDLARELQLRDQRTWQATAGLGELADSTAVIYVAADRAPRARPDPDDLRDFLRRVETVPMVLIIASAARFDPTPHHPGLVGPDYAGRHASNPIAHAWQTFEGSLDTQPFPRGQRRVVIRVPSLVPSSSGPGYCNPGFGDLLSGRRSWTALGHDPPLQWIEVPQLAEQILRVLRCPPPEATDLVHLAPAGQTARLSRVLRRRAIRRWRLPVSLSLLWDRLTGRRGSTDYRRYPVTLLEAEGDGVPETLSQEDPFGLDRAYIDRLGRTLFRALHDLYWRIELAGLDRVPKQGGAVLVGVHRGFQPWDGVMTMHAIARRQGRYLRFLIHPSLVKLPFLEPFMRRLGGVLAHSDNADWVLERGHLLGVYPEGIRGAFTPYRKAYRIPRLGRGEFIQLAIRHQVPIVPFVTVGSAEIFPIVARFRWPAFSRYTLWPWFPITTPLPLPSKWHTEFLEPIPTRDHYDPESADDPHQVRQLHDLVLERMRQSMQRQLAARPSRFWGDIFDDEVAP